MLIEIGDLHLMWYSFGVWYSLSLFEINSVSIDYKTDISLWKYFVGCIPSDAVEASLIIDIMWKTWRQSRLMRMKTLAHLFWCATRKAHQKLVSNSNPKMLRRLNWTSDKVPLHCVASLHLCNCSYSLFNFVLVTHHPLFQITPVLNNNIGLSLSEPLRLYQRQSCDSSAG